VSRSGGPRYSRGTFVAAGEITGAISGIEGFTGLLDPLDSG
jgi:hypothetical protein